MTVCLLNCPSWANAEQQIKLEDIERDTLIGESKKSASEEKEDSTQTAENSQHIQLTYSGGSGPDVYVTPQPGKYSNHKGEDLLWVDSTFVDGEQARLAWAIFRKSRFSSRFSLSRELSRASST